MFNIQIFHLIMRIQLMKYQKAKKEHFCLFKFMYEQRIEYSSLYFYTFIIYFFIYFFEKLKKRKIKIMKMKNILIIISI